MTTTEISNTVINRAIYINSKWKVSVTLNDYPYGFRIEGADDISDTDLSDLIYQELLTTEVYVAPVVVPIVQKETLEGLVPRQK